MNKTIHLLLIEDELAYAKLLSIYLEEQAGNFIVSHAATLTEGLEYLKQASFDALVIDLHLPDSYGIETLIKVYGVAPNTPIIVMTGLLKEELGIEAVSKGAQDYLLKETINGQNLARALRYALERHSLLSQLQQKIQHAESSFYKLVQNNVDGVIILSKAMVILFANDAAVKLFGKPKRDLLGKPFGFSFKDETTELEIVRSRGDSSIVEMRLVNMAWQGKEVHLASLRDISQRKIFEMQLEHQAHHDSLTNLPNRRYIEWHFKEWTSHNAYDERQMALIYFDLNRFKQVNDTLGHPVGDELLKQVAKRLKGIKREHDVVARMGGDEFALLVAVENEKEASIASKRIAEILFEPISIFEHSLQVEASLGIAIWTQEETFDDLLRRADVAMYHAKTNHTSFQFYNTSIDEKFHEFVWLEKALSEAIHTNSLDLHYQPIVSAQTGAYSSAEALLRWQHPEKGQVSPMTFIPVAESMGLMPELDNWVIQKAVSQAATSQFDVAINISARSLQNEQLVETILASLHDNRLNPTKLCLEVTEHVLVASGRPLQTLSQLRENGIKIAVDDFGTGYSSLAYLDTYPLTTLKVDRHFVQSSLNRPKTMAISKSIIQLANDLELETVVEGVETAEEYSCFRQLGCSFIQGYLTGKPMPLESLTQRLSSKNSLKS